MKIQVKTDGHNISIPLPTGLILSKPSVWLYRKMAKKHSSHTYESVPENIAISMDSFLTQLPEEAVYAICDEIKRIKRHNGAWELVEVYSSSGEEVHITL